MIHRVRLSAGVCVLREQKDWEGGCGHLKGDMHMANARLNPVITDKLGSSTMRIHPLS